MSETYEIMIQCHNCKRTPPRVTDPDSGKTHPKLITIPKGTEVRKFLQDMTCENCDCGGFMGIL